MTDIIHALKEHIYIITLNRVEKHNAFDDKIILQLQDILDKAIDNPQVKVIILNANGNHFSAGADLEWMQKMVHFDEKTNQEDAKRLGQLLYTLYHSPKPTLAVVQGIAYGGGAGLVAACDMAIASHDAKFCFSEVKLGLIPALISPYVVKAIGERLAKWLFMTAKVFDAFDALRYNLIQYCTEDTELQDKAWSIANELTQNAPEAVFLSKKLVQAVSEKPIDERLLQETALLIAQKRVSKEGQLGLQAFLNKESPKWN